MKKNVAIILSILGVTAITVVVPVFTLATALGITFSLAVASPIINKLYYKNKKSSLMGITRDNVIQQRLNMSLLKNSKINNKGKFFEVEMFNLLLDMKGNKKYETISQNIVLRNLKKIEKLGYIENLQYESDTINNDHVNKKAIKKNNKTMNKVNSFLVNLGMGNFKNMTKEQKNYEINFNRTDKEINQDTINEILSSNYVIKYTRKKKIKKIKFIDSKDVPLNDNSFIKRKNEKKSKDRTPLELEESKKKNNEFSFNDYLVNKKEVEEIKTDKVIRTK